MRSFWELRTLAQTHEVDLFCFYDDQKDERYFGQLQHYCNHYYVERVSFVLSCVRALWALLRGRPFSTAFFYSRRMSRQLQSALRIRHYDRIFVFSSSMASYVEASRTTPRILDFVDVDSDKWRQYADRKSRLWSWVFRLEAKRLAAYELFLARTFDTAMVCTEAEATLLRSRDPHLTIQVLENHLDVAQYDPAEIFIPNKIRSWQPYVVFSGSMDYLPNVDAACFFYREIFPLIKRARPDVQFVIVGRNPHPSLRRLATDNSVQITGSVPDIRPYICAAEVAVAPMRIARGVQNKVLEALAAGRPVVTSSVVAAALGESLRPLIRVADNPADFAASVLQALTEGPCQSGFHVRDRLRTYMSNRASSVKLEHLVREARHGIGKTELAECGTEHWA
jgi:sugar transferase (PEP-CTERM/EpsH1 system associated)